MGTFGIASHEHLFSGVKPPPSLNTHCRVVSLVEWISLLVCSPVVASTTTGCLVIRKDYTSSLAHSDECGNPTAYVLGVRVGNVTAR